MADYTAKTAVHKTLSAATVDTVTLDGAQAVEVVNRGSTDSIYFCIDGRGGPSADGVPTVGGNDTDVVPPGQVLSVRSDKEGVTVVKLISTGAMSYSVKGILY